MNNIQWKHIVSLIFAVVMLTSVSIITQFPNVSAATPGTIGTISSNLLSGSNGQIHFYSHSVTSGKAVSQTSSPGELENLCPTNDKTHVVLDVYLLTPNTGKNSVELTLFSGSDGVTYSTSVPIIKIVDRTALGSTVGMRFLDTSSPFVIGENATDPNVPDSGSSTPVVDPTVNIHTKVRVVFNATGDQYYQLHGKNIDATGKASNFYFYYLDSQSQACTQTPQKATLNVIKIVDNGNTGSTNQASDFTINVSGTNVSPASFPGSDSPGTSVSLDAGSYSVSESDPSGYASSLSSDCTGTISIGEIKTCTITNTAIAPKLTVIKIVDNGNTGSTNQASNFTLNVDGSPQAQNTATNSTVGNHTVTETGPNLPEGYTATFSGDCDSSGSVSLNLGDDKTCTITNTAIAPKLTVIKHVINDNGGIFTASDFTMNVTGSSPSPESSPGAESPGTNVTLGEGSYSVSESGPVGYTSSLSDDCAGTISIGQVKTCTITNDDEAGGGFGPKAHLVVIKHVINDNGGIFTAANFTMNVAGSSPLPASFPGSESPGTVVIVAGSYSVSESGPVGYTSSLSADCTGTILAGQVKTCTITNNDIQPKLLVIKHVINDNLGTATASSFTMNVAGSSPSPASFPGAESPGTTVTLNTGSYSVSESGPVGYTSSLSADCTGTISIGQVKTCTITNNDVGPTRTLGFFQTHTSFTTGIFNAPTHSSPGVSAHSITIGSGSHIKTIDTTNKLFGAYYSSIPSKSDSTKRSSTDQARMVLLQQLLTAKINCAVFGCDSITQATITTADGYYATGTAAQMNTVTNLLNTYNNLHDSLSIVPLVEGSSTPSVSQGLASTGGPPTGIKFWDAP
ncbi:MAG: hypothetical protein ACREAD_04915 [Nitrosopumilaceae archaeon]